MNIFEFFLILITFIILLIPFLPGFIELMLPKDNLPLKIEMDPVFGPKEKIARLENQEHPLVFNEDYTISAIEERKEIYAIQGKAFVLPFCQVKGIRASGPIELAAHVTIGNWIDSQDSILAKLNCNMGSIASASKHISLSQGCRFKELFAPHISTIRKTDSKHTKKTKSDIDFSKYGLYASRDLTKIPHNAFIPHDIYSVQNILVEDGAKISGSISSEGKISIGENVEIQGNLFAKGDIEIGEGSSVLGNIFSQKIIHIQHNAQVGTQGSIKSVIGKQGIILESAVTLHGYAYTEGVGTCI